LSVWERSALRAGNVSIVFPEESKDMTHGSYVKIMSRPLGPGQASKQDPKLYFDGIRCVWETKVTFDDISVPIKYPLDTFQEELGEVR
jgi:hypothetical protein